MTPRPSAGRRALEFFSKEEPQGLDIYVPLPQHPQELGILDLQLLQAPRVRDLQAPELRLPSIKGLVRDPEPAADVRRLCPRLMLLQRVDDLLLWG